jgi:hypothetical protein
MKKLLILIVIVLFGCGDDYIIITLNIDNRTNETFVISFPQKRPPFECLPYKVTIFDKVETRKANNFDCTPHITRDDVEVNTYSGKILKKDIWDGDNWLCNGNKDNGWEMTFVITEDDLE